MARQGGRATPRDRTVGVVQAITPSGQLIVRSASDRFSPEGTPLVDASGRHHGRVSRVFGPVARPYLAVRLRRAPNPADGVALVGQSLAVEEGRRNAAG